MNIQLLIAESKKGKGSADELPKQAKLDMAETFAQFDKLKNQMEDTCTMAGIQPLSKTHDEESIATTATSEKVGTEFHADFCSFKQQTRERFEEQTKEIHQLVHDSDKTQQHLTKELASKTLEVLKKFQEEMSRSVTKIDENSSSMKEEIDQLRKEQERHGKILEELKRMNDEIPAIKSLLEKIQEGSQVSQGTQPIRLEPIQLEMMTTQLKEELRKIHSS